MIDGFGLVCVWVFDQDEARDFYVGKLGFEIGTDLTHEGLRWLVVHPAGHPEVPLALNVPGPPIMDEATGERIRSLVSTGLLGPGALRTKDCRATYADLRAKGVEFIGEPEETFYGIDVGFRDPFGNHWRLAQLST